MRLRSASSLALLALLALSCAQDVGDINRVQPNHVTKKNFDGVWYVRQTVTEVPYENGILFEGYEAEMDKIRWEITETQLIAYRTYEFIPGANAPRANDAKYDGQPVLAYPISSHFDIQRGYNPSTGEVTNVIGENTTDRPWWQREYMRVDWSGVAFTNNTNLAGQLVQGGIVANQFTIPETEIDNPDRAQIGADAINVVNRVTFLPDEYSCYAEFNDWWSYNSNCGNTNLKLRTSFLRVSPNRAPYEPLDYPNARTLTDESGKPFRTVTLCAATDRSGNCLEQAPFACTDEFMDVVRTAARNPDLKASDVCDEAKLEYFTRFGFFRTERITYDRQYGHTETGRLFRANRWNIWENAVDAQGNVVPYAERRVKPIVYHLNVNFPEDVKAVAYETAAEWNKAFRETVEALTGKEAPADVFVLKENGCEVGNVNRFVSAHGLEDAVKGVTGERGLEAVSTASLPRVCAALEYVTANRENAAERFTWQKTGDLRYSFLYWVNQPQLSGPLGYGPSAADPETGEIISGDAYLYGGALDTYAQSATDMILALNGELDTDDIISGANIRAVVAANREARRELEGARLTDDLRGFLRSRVERAGETREERMEGLTRLAPGWQDARLGLVKGTRIEREKLIDQETLMLARGYRPGAPITEDVLQRASPAHWASPRLRAESRARMQKFLKNCVYYAEFADDSIIGLALQYKAEGKTAREIFVDVRNAIFKGVALHEVGHTVGLRHNFEASTDALNYFDEFWDIQAATADRDQRLARRQPEYRYASIMDYGAKFNSDLHGLGKYDLAAIRFGYGQLVDVWDGVTPEVEGSPLTSAGDLKFITEAVVDYTELPDLFGGKDNLKKRKAVHMPQLVEGYRAGTVANTAEILADPSKLSAILNDQPNVRIGAAYQRPNEVPYRFCTDEQESFTTTCRVWDEGSNAFEQSLSLAEMYKNYYVFSAFKRDRFNYDPYAYLDRLYARYFRRFVETFQHNYYYGEYYESLSQYYFGRASGPSEQLQLGTLVGINTLGAVFQTPEPGDFCVENANNAQKGQYVPADDAQTCAANSTVNIPLGIGRPYWSDFSDDPIHWQFTTAGAYYERLAALLALTDSSTYVAAVDSLSDSRRFSLSFYREFKEELVDLFGGIIADDLKPLSGTITNRQFQARPLIPMPGFPALDANAKPLVAPNTWNLRNYATYFGMALFTSTMDDQMDFTRYTKVALKGSNEDIFRAPGVEVAEATDPFTRYTYVAANTTDGLGVGFKMVAALKTRIDQYDTAKSAFDAMPVNASNPAWQRAQTNVFRLQRQIASDVEFLDDMRLYNTVFAFGG